MNEVWKPINGTNGEYEVSNLGSVRSLDKLVGHRWGGTALKRGKLLKPRTDKDGYLFISLSSGGVQKQAKLHRLVAGHFLDACGLNEVNHKDFDKTNNAVTNLEWTSRAGNQRHASEGGKFNATTNPRRAKTLTLETVEAIRKAREEGLTFAAIGAKFGCSAPTALKVCRGYIWK